MAVDYCNIFLVTRPVLRLPEVNDGSFRYRFSVIRRGQFVDCR